MQGLHRSTLYPQGSGLPRWTSASACRPPCAGPAGPRPSRAPLATRARHWILSAVGSRRRWRCLRRSSATLRAYACVKSATPATVATRRSSHAPMLACNVLRAETDREWPMLVRWGRRWVGSGASGVGLIRRLSFKSCPNRPCAVQHLLCGSG